MNPNCEIVPDPTKFTLCQADPKASQVSKDRALDYVCGNGVLCGRCQNPSNILSWALNQYFQAHLETGASACDFQGVGQLSWPKASPCIPSSSKGEPICKSKGDATNDRLQKDIVWICSKYPSLCELIKPGGACIFPTAQETRMKADFAFNEYYKKWKDTLKEKACDFQGDGELVKASESSVVFA